ncbi:MAG: aminotransferase class I/II-fold pyridoxal phosphate-dependent enzyme [Calditrichaeota bacterium]|nr:MAG: aminotransferase class I/II-fold pyridoxal phosphate-dependent enzyme [Calditrichota bacterium]MBL1205612.1 aminotransferase class I/II-fold pyridoxal phosphate-dependent enzyme [Calditrichota bacterium]NOG45440.1 aminotransferase class I/II-fold pyridoxal phosphate-dependent enzyme [Calditrichota bacterium]
MYKTETKDIRNQFPRSENREHSVPLYLTSSFVFEDAEQGRALFANEISGNIYSRFSNPNTTEFVGKMCSLEKMDDGFAFASGMAALFAGFAGLLKSGDHILASRALFGSTYQILVKILSRWGITTSFVNATQPEEWESKINKNTKMLFIETPSNPGLDIVDLSLAQQLKNKYNLILFIDNTFATPILQTPADYGADLIAHSATKYIDGQGRACGGVIVGKQELIDEVRFFARQTGPSMAPFNAWLFSKSLETLSLRMERHCSNALALARELDQNQHLTYVRYPGLESHPQFLLAQKQMKGPGGIVTFLLKGGYDRAQKFIDSLQVISKTANLGDTRSVATHPSSTTHSKLTVEEQEQVLIYPGLVRISVGLESSEDIIEDVTQAIKKSEKGK